MATTGSMSAGALSDAIEYRPMERVDVNLILPLMKAYLEESCPDIVPNDMNVATLLSKAAPASFAALENKPDGKIIGFTLLSPINNLQTTVKILHSVGTYVLPEYRRRGIGERLRRLAMYTARELGYDKLQGVAYSERAATSVGRLGGKAVAIVLETPLQIKGE